MAKSTYQSARKYRIWNVLGLLFVLTLNGLANGLPINGYNTGELSAMYPNLFVPAGFSFAIWGLIFALLAVLVVGYFLKQKRPIDRQRSALGYWFLFSCIANGTWILAWHYRLVGFSVFVMLCIFFSLFTMYQRIHKAGGGFSVSVSLPISIYFGWISVATIANFTAFLVSRNWSAWGLSETTWTIALIAIVVALGLFMLVKFTDIAFNLVLIWALFGIFMKQYFTGVVSVGSTALIALIVLSACSLYFGIRRGSLLRVK